MNRAIQTGVFLAIFILWFMAGLVLFGDDTASNGFVGWGAIGTLFGYLGYQVAGAFLKEKGPSNRKT